MAITDIPIAVGNSLGITDPDNALLIGGLILSSAALIAIILMMNYASRGRSKNMLGEIIVVFCGVGVLTAIAWLPVWILIVAILIAVSLFAGKIAEVVSK